MAAGNAFIRHKLAKTNAGKGFPGVRVLAKDEILWGEKRVGAVPHVTPL